MQICVKIHANFFNLIPIPEFNTNLIQILKFYYPMYIKSYIKFQKIFNSDNIASNSN